MKFNFFRNFLAAISIWTMIFSPVAYGLQSKAQFDRVTQDQMKSMLIDLGLNKKTTYGQFWDRTKHLYPAQVYADVEAYFKAQPSTVMPAFEVTYTQSAKGEKIPTLKITERGQTYNVEIIGELNEWARVNQVSLSESDLTRLKPAIEKLSPGSTKLEVYRKDFARFEGFPRMTPQTWRLMKPEERAAYIVKMRLLWFEARRVIEANEPEARMTPIPKKPKKTSSFEEFLKLMIGEVAQAEGNDQQSHDDRKTFVLKYNKMPPVKFNESQRKIKSNYGKPCLADSPLSGGGCIVAGYVAPADGKYTLTWTSNNPTELVCGCDYESVMTQRLNTETGESFNALVKQKELEEVCKEKYVKLTPTIPHAEKGDWVPCQTDIYSFDAKDGSPFCMHTMSPEFQRATSSSSQISNPNLNTCDEQSQLNTKDYVVSKNAAENQAQTEAQQAATDFKLTKNYLDGMIKAEKLGYTMDHIVDPNKEFSPEEMKKIDNFLTTTQGRFEDQIKKAIGLCTASGSRHEKNHKDACDQLHRRWLFTEKYIAQFRGRSCLDKSTYIGSYDARESFSKSSLVTVGNEKISKSELNKRSLSQLEGIPVCKCPDIDKLVPLGKSCIDQIVVKEGKYKCPSPGSTPKTLDLDDNSPFPRGVKEMCICESNKKSFNVYEDAYRSGEEFKKICSETVPPRSPRTEPEAEDCSRFASVSTVLNSDNKCVCAGGSLKNSPPQLVSNTADKYTCDEETNLWPLVPFMLLPFLMRDKSKRKPLQCAANQIPQVGQCVCKYTSFGLCPNGPNADCTGCAAIVPTCYAPKAEGSWPNCFCSAPKSGCGKNMMWHPEKCYCEPVEGGTAPDLTEGGGTPTGPSTNR